MRLQIVTCLLLGVALCAAQDAPRRERLRNLISAARSGDTEARAALRDLRTQLKSRKAGEENNRRRPVSSPQEQRVEAPKPRPQAQREFQAPAEVTTFQPLPPVETERVQVVQQKPRIVEEVQPEVAIPVKTLQPTRASRVHQLDTPRRSSVDQDPHRALNRGLEIDTRSEKGANIHVTNLTKTPPIETIRRYSYFDEAGNYIFGYEAADGSFKEEKRGLDCVVHGKYGYVDPDGVKREFSYTSGNQCDPNAPRASEHQEPEQEPRPQNNQFLIQTQEQQVDENTLNQLQVNRRRQPASRQQGQRTQIVRQPEPQFKPQETLNRQIQPQPIEVEQPIKVEQPVEAPVEGRAQSPPPQRQQIIVNLPEPTERPAVVFRPTIKPLQPQQFNFDQEFKNLFSFASNHFTPAQFKKPDPRPTPVRQEPVRQQAERQEVARQEPAVRPEPARPAPTQAPRVAEPVTHAPRNQAHQLVFDAATGAFKTIPLSNLVTVAPLPAPRNPPPQQINRPQPSQHIPAHPTFPFGANPLPSVPLGSLSFDAAAASEFDNFFNQFHIRPKSK